MHVSVVVVIIIIAYYCKCVFFMFFVHIWRHPVSHIATLIQHIKCVKGSSVKYNEKTNMQWIQFNVVGTKSVFITYVYDYFRCCWVVYTLIHNNRHRHIQSHAIFNTINAKKAIQYQIYCIHILKKWSKFSCKIWLQLFVHGNGKLCRIKCVLVCTKWKTFPCLSLLLKQ